MVAEKVGYSNSYFFVTIILLSYLFPEFGKDKAMNVIIMFVRSVFVMLIWYYLLSPLILKMLKKFLKKKQSIYGKEIDEAINLFPHFKNIINYSWTVSSHLKGLKKIKSFVNQSFNLLLFTYFYSE